MWDRQALPPLYGFDYRWEVYTPAARRRWGYYVLPILFGDKLVGRIEPRIDRGSKEVRILGLGWEDAFHPLETPGFVPAFAEALNAYLEFAGVDTLVPAADRAHRSLFAALAGRVRVRRGSSRRARGGAKQATRPAVSA
jgi:Uncharacterized protein conserved in bacteria